MSKKDRLNIPDISFQKAVDAYIPLYAYVPLKDSEGNECVQKTALNTRITEGQILGRNDAFSAAVHAPVPGVLVQYRNFVLTDGKPSEAAVIKMSGEFTYKGKKLRMNSWDETSPNDLCSIFADSGVVNTFSDPCSLSREISQSMERDGERSMLAVRLFDPDPSCRTDSFLANFKNKEVLEGAAIIGKAMEAKKIFIFHDKSFNVPEVVPYSNIVFIQVPASKQLMCGTREMNLMLKKKKFDVKITVSTDAVTAFAAYEAVVFGKPMLERFVQISGNAIKKNVMLKTRIGTPVAKLLEQCGGYRKKPYRIIVNGLIKGTAIADTDMPVTDVLKSVTFISKVAIPEQKQTECVHCGNCHKVCPVKIHPDKLFDSYFYNTELPEKMINTAALCTQCGLCDTGCPSRLPLYQAIKLIKEDLK